MSDAVHPSVLEASEITRNDSNTGRTLLSHVNLTLRAGESLGLVGASGSGKSTLLRAIAQLDPIQSGDLRFRGATIDADDIPDFRRQVVYLSQRSFLVPGTVEQNLALPFSYVSARKSFDRNHAIELLGLLGRDESILGQNDETISGGERQLIALVRAILVGPSVLLLDEPTASLDATSIERFESLVRRWKNANDDHAWIWTSHDSVQISRMNDQVMRLASGKVVNE